MILHLAAAVGLRVLLSGAVAPEPRVYLDAASPVAAGQLVTVRWEGLPADAGELELLLDVDGGRSRLRITEELDPRAGSYAWSVAAVSARNARLILRMNRGGREIEIAPSAPFDVVPGDAAPRASLLQREGEIWLADMEEGDCAPPEPVSTLAGSPVTIRSYRAAVFLALPDRSDAPRPGRSVPMPASVRVSADERPLPNDLPRFLAFPRRI
ncbi:MAG TPA: hypothetical protein VH854_02000 [Thermoanaerobaculia bacterium]|nr:hypothetical protein [Thermoanaerobaculia bacterium]